MLTQPVAPPRPVPEIVDELETPMAVELPVPTHALEEPPSAAVGLLLGQWLTQVAPRQPTPPDLSARAERWMTEHAPASPVHGLPTALKSVLPRPVLSGPVLHMPTDFAMPQPPALATLPSLQAPMLSRAAEPPALAGDLPVREAPTPPPVSPAMPAVPAFTSATVPDAVSVPLPAAPAVMSAMVPAAVSVPLPAAPAVTSAKVPAAVSVPLPGAPMASAPSPYLQVPFDNGRLNGSITVEKHPGGSDHPLQVAANSLELRTLLHGHLRSHGERFDLTPWAAGDDAHAEPHHSPGREQGSGGQHGQRGDEQADEPPAPLHGKPT